MPPRVSLAMTARRDAPTLGRCLASCADLADEIVIVTDPGAAPAWTAEVERFGTRPIEFAWRESFAAARNEALRRSSGEWVFYLDADEWLDESQRAGLAALLADIPGEVVGFGIRQLSTTALGRVEAVEQIRLFRNDSSVRWRNRVHEQVAPALAGLGGLGGPVMPTDLSLSHDGYADHQTLAAKRTRNARLLALDLAQRPDDAYLLFYAGMTALEAGRPAEAARLLDRSRRRGAAGRLTAPAGRLAALLAQAFALAGDPVRALAACEEGLRTCGDDPELLFVRGTLLFQAGRPDRAEAALQRCLERQPTHARAWQLAGDLCLTQRRMDEAEALAARLEQMPEMAVDAAILRARILITRGEEAVAVGSLDQAIRSHPQALLLHELLAGLHRHRGDRPEAEAALRRMLLVAPGHPWARRTLRGLARDAPQPGSAADRPRRPVTSASIS